MWMVELVLCVISIGIITLCIMLTLQEVKEL